MARPGLARHRKFKRLARDIDDVARGFGEVLARGLLETLWDAAYEAGVEYLGDSADVESLAGWRGSEGLLCAALRDAGGDGHAGFIEEGASTWWPEGKPGTFRVHDLWDHAPDYVRKRRQRENERQEKGAVLRRAAVSDQSMTGQRPPNGSQRPENGRTRSPSPSPSPSPTQEDACAERVASAPPPAPASPVVFTLKCSGKGPAVYEVHQAQVEEWSRAFPGVEIMAELRKSSAWQDANPSKRKTHRGMAAHLVGWFTRTQDGANRNGAATPQARPDFTDPTAYREVSLLGGRP